MRKEIQAEAVRSEINVTPLVDVCLVMLVIFMVVTPMLGPHKDVKLPTAPDPGEVPKKERRVLPALKADGTTWLEEKALPIEAIGLALEELHARAPEKEIVVMADEALSFGQVRPALALVRDSGFGKANLPAVKEKGPGLASPAPGRRGE